MSQLENLNNFIRIVEANGIGRAAQQMDIAKSAVSRRLSELEEHFGVKLFNRTTRKISLTEAGHTCYQHALGILDAMGELESQLSHEQRQLKGTLNVALPLDFALEQMVELVDEFKQRHPQLQLNLDLSDRVIDVVASGVDLAIRVSAGLPDSSLQARTLAAGKAVLVASPGYLQQFGAPKSPQDLIEHSFIRYPNDSASHVTLQDTQGQIVQAAIRSDIVINSGRFIAELAVLGRGIAFQPEFICKRALQQGTLMQVLPGFSSPVGHVHAVYPKSKFVPAKVRVFIDFLVEWFAQHSL